MTAPRQYLVDENGRTWACDPWCDVGQVLDIGEDYKGEPIAWIDYERGIFSAGGDELPLPDVWHRVERSEDGWHLVVRDGADEWRHEFAPLGEPAADTIPAPAEDAP